MRLPTLIFLLAAAGAPLLEAQEVTDLQAYADSIERYEAAGYRVDPIEEAARFAALNPPPGFEDIHERLVAARMRAAKSLMWVLSGVPTTDIEVCNERGFTPSIVDDGGDLGALDRPRGNDAEAWRSRSVCAQRSRGIGGLGPVPGPRYVDVRGELTRRLAEYGVELKPLP
ncbi:MAG: hypothetical protein HKM89_01525, partial [Gemmatimonadales bacterium]|nr:hypothetical protein [Gemmatimonadales bacterium]